MLVFFTTQRLPRVRRRAHHVRLARHLLDQPAPHGQGGLGGHRALAASRRHRQCPQRRPHLVPRPLPPQPLATSTRLFARSRRPGPRPDRESAEELCLAIDIGGTKLAAGLRHHRGRLLDGRRAPTPSTAERRGALRHAGRRWSVRCSLVAAADGGGVRHRLRRAHGPARGHRVAAQHPGMARVPPARPRGGGHRVSPSPSTTTPRRSRWPKAGPGRREGGATFSPWWCPPAWAGDRRRRALCSRATSGNAGHVGHVIVEPDGRLCRCGARGCLEAEASGTAIAAMTGSPPAEASPEVVSRTGRLVGRAAASVASLLDIELCRDRRVRGARFRRSVLRCRQRRAARQGPVVVHVRARASCPVGWGQVGRSWVRAHWAGGGPTADLVQAP